MHSSATVWALVVVLAIGQSRADDPSPNAVPTTSRDSCGSSPSGSLVTIGRYYYKCNDGQLEPQGCIDGAQKQVPIGQNFRLANYQMSCKLGSDGFMTTEYDSCVIKETVVAPGGTFENDKYWYTCTKDGNFPVEHLSGCLRNGKRLNLHERVVEGDIVYECQDTSTLPDTFGVACAVDGKQYNIGETFTDEKFIYACTDKAGKPTKETYGCVKGEKKYYGWQTYAVNDVLYRCEVKGSAKGARHVVAGCINKENKDEKPLGCHWVVGTAPKRYTMFCEQTAVDAVVQKSINCVYGDFKDGQDNGVIIEAGCYRKIDKQLIACRNSTSGTGVEYLEGDAANVDSFASQNNLQNC